MKNLSVEARKILAKGVIDTQEEEKIFDSMWVEAWAQDEPNGLKSPFCGDYRTDIYDLKEYMTETEIELFPEYQKIYVEAAYESCVYIDGEKKLLEDCDYGIWGLRYQFPDLEDEYGHAKEGLNFSSEVCLGDKLRFYVGIEGDREGEWLGYLDENPVLREILDRTL